MKAVGILVAIALLAGCDSRKPFGDFERMRVQHRYDTYAASHAFADGITMQAPPAHTVSVESGSDTGVVGSGMSGAQPATAIPLAITPELLATGKRGFTVFCAACHGAAGFGGSVVASNMVEKRPPSLRGPLVRALPAGTIFRVATQGFGVMPSYGWQLSTRERWAVVAYIQHLQNTPPTDSASIQDSLRALSFASQPAPDSR